MCYNKTLAWGDNDNDNDNGQTIVPITDKKFIGCS